MATEREIDRDWLLERIDHAIDSSSKRICSDWYCVRNRGHHDMDAEPYLVYESHSEGGTTLVNAASLCGYAFRRLRLVDKRVQYVSYEPKMDPRWVDNDWSGMQKCAALAGSAQVIANCLDLSNAAVTKWIRTGWAPKNRAPDLFRMCKGAVPVSELCAQWRDGVGYDLSDE